MDVLKGDVLNEAGTNEELLDKHVMSSSPIADAVREVIERKETSYNGFTKRKYQE